MSLLKTLHIAHLPLPVHIALYKDLKNASWLRQRILSQNSEFEYAFIDATTVLSETHVLAAVFRAINDYLNGRLKTHNIHSEIVFSFSPNNNIGESFRKFGISDRTKNLLVIKASVSPEITRDTITSHLETAVDGTIVPFSDDSLSEVSDIDKIKKAYKIGPSPTTKASPKLLEANGMDLDEKHFLELSIVGAIALRGAT